MKEYTCERIYRDARITSIYEGTTQLQVVAAIRYVTNGVYLTQLRDYEAQPHSEQMQPLVSRLSALTDKYAEAVEFVTSKGNQEYLDFMARRLYEMAGTLLMAHLLCVDATRSAELFEKSAKVYVNYISAEIEKHYSFIMNFDPADVEMYKK